MSTPTTKRRARDLALHLLSDVNDRDKFRFFRVRLDLRDEVDFQVMNDLIEAMHTHGAPIMSHSVISVLTENHGVQKVVNEVSLICSIEQKGWS